MSTLAAQRPTDRPVRNRRTRWSAQRIIGLVVLTLVVVFAVFPLLWMALASLKPYSGLYRFPVEWIPKALSWDFYSKVFHNTPFGRYMVNTIIVSSCTAIGVVALSAMAGFGLARGKLRGRRALSRSLLIAYIFPPSQIAIPLFIIVSRAGFAGTYTGIIIVFVAFNLPFCAMLMEQYFETLPPGVEEAARVDGCSNLGVFLRIALPLAGPGLGTTAVFAFLHSWNEFLLALVILGNGGKQTLPVGIYSFVGGDIADWGALMASCTMVVLPTLVMFLIAQRRITSGLTAGAVTG